MLQFFMPAQNKAERKINKFQRFFFAVDNATSFPLYFQLFRSISENSLKPFSKGSKWILNWNIGYDAGPFTCPQALTGNLILLPDCRNPFESLATSSESLASPSLPFCDENRRLGSAGDEAFNLLMSLLFMCEEDVNKSEARANLIHNPRTPPDQ